MSEDVKGKFLGLQVLLSSENKTETTLKQLQELLLFFQLADINN